jgi:hypothetical protein
MQDKQSTAVSSTKTQGLVQGLWGVRYQVKDVQRSIGFYTQKLGFNLDQQNLPAFGQVSISKSQTDPQRSWGLGFSAYA